MIVHPEIKIVIIYLLSCHYKPFFNEQLKFFSVICNIVHKTWTSFMIFLLSIYVLLRAWKPLVAIFFYGLYENTYILPIIGFGKTRGWVNYYFFFFELNYPLKLCTSFWSLNSLFKTCIFLSFYSTTYDLALIFQKLGFSISVSVGSKIYIHTVDGFWVINRSHMW